MNKTNCPLILLWILPILLFAQNDDYRLAPGITPAQELPQYVLPELDNKALYQAEMARRGPGIAPKFAENIEVDISPATHGIWETASNGNLVWRIRLYSQHARSLNLGFSKYIMPPGGSLILYEATNKIILGPFTPADNEDHEQLWTPIVEGDDLVVEVQLPPAEQSNLKLTLKSVNHDFIGFAEMSSSIVSGSCNLDVICGAADGWGIVDGYRDIIRSVAVISTGGSTSCTGFLVNNVLSDCTPFFMTADHCGINSGTAPSLVTYWNFENSTCRQPDSPESGGPGDGQLNDFNTGSIFRCAYDPSDMTLVELDDPVSETANAFFAGWSAEFVMPEDTIIAIHHPSTDEKRISFEFQPAQPGAGLSDNVVDISVADHVIVPDWDIGTTEPGSSGSPLFNNQKQVVGQLHGGGAACGNDLYDSYGWFNTSWEGGGTPATALKFWLDPNDSGILSIPGKDCGFSIGVEQPVATVCAPADAVYNLVVAENFAGDVTLTAANLPPGTTATFDPNPAAPGASVTLTISNTNAVASGQYSITVEGTDGADEASSNISLTVFDGAPASVGLQNPPDLGLDITTSPLFGWDPAINSGNYEIEVAYDADITNVVASVTGLTDPQYLVFGLDVLTTYYWRVRANNNCGIGPWSETWSFTTANIACTSDAATDVPIPIDSGLPNTVVSTLEINSSGEIIDINVANLDISHTYVGDLAGTLTSPEGTMVQLFNQPSSCSEDNLLVSFDDTAPNTSTDFEQTCNGSPLAISGDFQTVDPLAAFNGENPQGIWTLTIFDLLGLDGGNVNGWNLEICATVIPDFSIAPSESEFDICTGQTVQFDLTMGTAFAGDITLSAMGNPAGSTIDFSANPVTPGGTTTVTISGITTSGSFTIDVEGTDGTDMGTTSITINAQEGPGQAVLTAPTNLLTNVSLYPTMSWQAATGSSSYLVEIAEDAGFTSIIDQMTVAGTSWSVVNALNFNTLYFWRVTAINDCGEVFSEVFEFTTVPNLELNINPIAQTICNIDEAVFDITVAEGFNDPASISFTISPSLAANVTFDVDPSNVPPGTTVSATLTDLAANPTGAYVITFMVDDGVNSSDIAGQLTLEAAPDQTTLTLPTDGATAIVVTPTLEWAAVPNAFFYEVEVATDAAFANIILTEMVNTTNYTIPNPLAYQTTYYWRVTAENNCGGSLTDGFSFTTDILDNVKEIAGNAFHIQPNPSKGQTAVVFDHPTTVALHMELRSIDGRLLQRRTMAPGGEVLLVDLSSYSDGVYVIRLQTSEKSIARRIVLQR